MWVLAVTGWIAVVVAGSALTWVAIDRAGGQVTGSPGGGETQPVVVGTVGPAPEVTRTPTGTPTRKHLLSPSASPSHAQGPTGGSSPSHAAPTRTGSSPSKASSPAAPDPTVTRTWSGEAGSVTVSCSGRSLLFKSASPSDGWSFERSDDSGSEIEVTFKKGGTEVQVKSTCDGGVPQFRVESDTSADDD